MHLADFERLMPAFEAAYARQEAQRKSRVVKTGEERQRRPGGGAHFSTTLPERLLMLLIYYRMYLTQEFMTLLFDVEDKATISRAIRQMRPVFEAVLPVPERALRQVFDLARHETDRRKARLEERTGRRINNLRDFLHEFPEFTILIDGTEQPKQKPQDPAKRKSDYSGKKKRHTLKQIVTATPNGLILDQSPCCGGRRHDFSVFKEQVKEGALGRAMQEQFQDLRVVAYADSGFTGIDKLSLPVTSRIVERARRGHPLTAEQKMLGRVRSRERIKVEHAIGRRKKYRIAALIYRNRDADYDATMNVVAGLSNLRVYGTMARQAGLDLLEVNS
ncbi:MAG: transposase [Bacteroidetes bacterium]|nr:transposase [Bacteroidota bacterium]